MMPYAAWSPDWNLHHCMFYSFNYRSLNPLCALTWNKLRYDCMWSRLTGRNIKPTCQRDARTLPRMPLRVNQNFAIRVVELFRDLLHQRMMRVQQDRGIPVPQIIHPRIPCRWTEARTHWWML
jgi:hypothetical protein